jgi:peroxin-5
MSRGELIIDDNQVKETVPASGDWAAEYQQEYNRGSAWAGEFLNEKVYPISSKPYSSAGVL